VPGPRASIWFRSKQRRMTFGPSLTWWDGLPQSEFGLNWGADSPSCTSESTTTTTTRSWAINLPPPQREAPLPSRSVALTLKAIHQTYNWEVHIHTALQCCSDDAQASCAHIYMDHENVIPPRWIATCSVFPLKLRGIQLLCLLCTAALISPSAEISCALIFLFN